MTAANNPGADRRGGQQSIPSQMGWITTDARRRHEMADIAAYLGTFVSGVDNRDRRRVLLRCARSLLHVGVAPRRSPTSTAARSPGWVRTGLTFKALRERQPPGASPVCRFYLPPAFGDSHFYSASPAECAQVAATYPGFVYETAAALYIGLPDTSDGRVPVGDGRPSTACGTTGPTPITATRRAATVRQQMQAQGWIAEGYGPSASHLHLHRIEMRGYRRADGLYEIEGRVTDTKSHTTCTRWSTARGAGRRTHPRHVGPPRRRRGHCSCTTSSP